MAQGANNCWRAGPNYSPRVSHIERSVEQRTVLGLDWLPDMNSIAIGGAHFGTLIKNSNKRPHALEEIWKTELQNRRSDLLLDSPQCWKCYLMVVE